MMRLSFITALLLLIGCATHRVPEPRFDLKSLPQFDNGMPYRLEQFVPAAMALQAIGQEAGTAALLQAAATPETVDKSVYYKVAVLCRMLFTARPGREFLRATLGSTDYLGDTTYDDWPLEPIELVHGYPFWVARGYRMGGARGPVTDYVRYCITECEWNTFRFRELTQAEKRAALAQLLRSPKWKRPPDEYARWFLSFQIE